MKIHQLHALLAEQVAEGRGDTDLLVRLDGFDCDDRRPAVPAELGWEVHDLELSAGGGLFAVIRAVEWEPDTP